MCCGQQGVGFGGFVEQSDMCGGCYFGFVFEVVLLIGMIEVYFEDYVVYECEFVFV